MSADSCACPTTDPVECIRRRYPGTSHDAAADEPCTCGCHHDAAEEEDDFDDGPDWCDRCSPDPCDCDEGPDDLSDLGPLDEDDDCEDNPGSVDGALSRLLDADPGGWAAFVGARCDD